MSQRVRVKRESDSDTTSVIRTLRLARTSGASHPYARQRYEVPYATTAPPPLIIDRHGASSPTDRADGDATIYEKPSDADTTSTNETSESLPRTKEEQAPDHDDPLAKYEEVFQRQPHEHACPRCKVTYESQGMPDPAHLRTLFPGSSNFTVGSSARFTTVLCCPDHRPFDPYSNSYPGPWFNRNHNPSSGRVIKINDIRSSVPSNSRSSRRAGANPYQRPLPRETGATHAAPLRRRPIPSRNTSSGAVPPPSDPVKVHIDSDNLIVTPIGGEIDDTTSDEEYSSDETLKDDLLGERDHCRPWYQRVQSDDTHKRDTRQGLANMSQRERGTHSKRDPNTSSHSVSVPFNDNNPSEPNSDRFPKPKQEPELSTSSDWQHQSSSSTNSNANSSREHRRRNNSSSSRRPVDFSEDHPFAKFGGDENGHGASGFILDNISITKVGGVTYWSSP